MTHNLRLMTYNVHRCIGRDKKMDISRIVDVLAEYDPDIIALQELDVSDEIDQPQEIASRLSMRHHFHPSMKVREGHYGNAVLSKYPIRLVREEVLPEKKHNLKRTIIERLLNADHEPRGVIWVEADVQGMILPIITTHLSLTTQERVEQIEYILNERFLNASHLMNPFVIMGDLNDGIHSKIYKKLNSRLRDAYTVVKTKPKLTFTSKIPFRCLDYIFVSEAINVKNVFAPRDELIISASDHLPVVADVELII